MEVNPVMSKTEFEELNKLSNIILSAALEVHKELGPGLLESVYEACLVEELLSRGINAIPQVNLPIIYKGKRLEKDFRIDILVENKFIIELKAIEKILPVHEVQLVTYLKLAEIKMGLLINFNTPRLKDGIKRKINGYVK